MSLVIHEIFHSIQGETTRAGFPSVFVRLAGCNLRCQWCDTPASLSGGEVMSLDDVMDRVCSFPRPDHVTVTGGEPMMQEETLSLISRLMDRGFTVQLETNGTLPLVDLPADVRKIVDIKPPSSGHGDSFLPENLSCLGSSDELKIIIANDGDLRFADDFIRQHLVHHPSVINLSPSGMMNPGRIASFIMKAPSAGIPCRLRLNLQIHKLLNIP